MKPLEILRQARNELMERGWHQGDFVSPDGRVCALGACQAALGFDLEPAGDLAIDIPTDIYRLLADVIPESYRGDVAAWNDAPERTIHDVLDAFDKAEKLALIAEES